MNGGSSGFGKRTANLVLNGVNNNSGDSLLSLSKENVNVSYSNDKNKPNGLISQIQDTIVGGSGGGKHETSNTLGGSGGGGGGVMTNLKKKYNNDKDHPHYHHYHNFHFVDCFCSKSVLRNLLLLLVSLVLLDKYLSLATEENSTGRMILIQQQQKENVKLKQRLENKDDLLKLKMGEFDNKLKEIEKQLNMLVEAGEEEETDDSGEDAIEKLEERLSFLEKKTKFLGDKLDNLLSVDYLSKLTQSEVRLTVLENIEMHGENRWVYPCNWDGCRKEKQGLVVARLLKQIQQEKQKKLKKKKKNSLRIIQLGSCSSNGLDNMLENLLNNNDGQAKSEIILDKYTIINIKSKGNRTLTNGNSTTFLKSDCDGILNENSFETLRGKYGSDIVDFFQVDSFNDLETLNQFQDKSFDALIMDHDPLHEYDELSSETIRLWFAKLRNEGVILGHAYGITLTNGGNNTKPMVPVSWLKTGSFLSHEQLAFTKQRVDSFIHSVKDRIDGRVRLAGDTVWYFFKRKVSLSDVFNN